jgi:hypothetical protein
MTNAARTSFASLEEFKESLVKGELLFFHVFERVPSAWVLNTLADGREGERLLLLDVNEDRGFLAATPITVEIRPDGSMPTRPLIELRGLGAWGRGTLYGFEQDAARISEFVVKARKFARPSNA